MHSPEQPDGIGTELLRLARGSIEHGFVHGEPLPVSVDGMPQTLSEPAATFTTLRLDGKLRGCVGSLKASRPLAVDAARTAFQAAFRDSRFDPLGRHELDAVTLDVSVLSPLEPFPVTDEADLLDKLTPGTDGLVIVLGARQATFLPKVWNQLPEPSQFLGGLKMKLGLGRDYWSDDLEFRRYRATTYADPI